MKGVVLGLLLACLVVVQASPMMVREERSTERRAKACTWTFSDCVPGNGECGQGTRVGTKSGEGCRVKQKTFSCRIPCPGEPETVEPQGKCRYDRGPWSDCNTSNNMQNRTLTLKRSKAGCDQMKVEQKKCKKECKYTKGDWGVCDPVTNMMSRVKQLKKGDSAKCNATITIAKPCKKNNMEKKKCKYLRQEWGECNTTTNQRTRVMVLKKGDPSECEQRKEITRKCRSSREERKSQREEKKLLRQERKKQKQERKRQKQERKKEKQERKKQKKEERLRGCKYMKGDWSDCEEGMTTRIDQLKQRNNNNPDCPPTRTKTKKCKCKYTWTWAAQCDDHNLRTRTMNLIKGDPKDCPQNKQEQKSCVNKRGQEACMYGPWGELSECVNGVKTKRREVAQGGQRCQARAVKTKRC